MGFNTGQLTVEGASKTCTLDEGINEKTSVEPSYPSHTWRQPGQDTVPINRLDMPIFV